MPGLLGRSDFGSAQEPRRAPLRSGIGRETDARQGDRKLSSDSGWRWDELSFVDQTNGGAPLAHRDALKLLAVFLQHTDSKPAQQRLICLDSVKGESGSMNDCAHPFMMLNDVGRTFGKANMFNKDLPGSVDFKAWSGMSIWKDKTGCVANMPKSMTGSLDNPTISEEGRKFLADLLGQLSDKQIRDLFEVARFTRRQPETTVEDWAAAFKQKREEIATRRCTLMTNFTTTSAIPPFACMY